jgi:hypothetical protein
MIVYKLLKRYSVRCETRSGYYNQWKFNGKNNKNNDILCLCNKNVGIKGKRIQNSLNNNVIYVCYSCFINITDIKHFINDEEEVLHNLSTESEVSDNSFDDDDSSEDEWKSSGRESSSDDSC